MSKELEDELILMGKNARKASQILTLATSEIKNNALEAMADDIEKNKENIIKQIKFDHEFKPNQKKIDILIKRYEIWKGLYSLNKKIAPKLLN